MLPPICLLAALALAEGPEGEEAPSNPLEPEAAASQLPSAEGASPGELEAGDDRGSLILAAGLGPAFLASNSSYLGARVGADLVFFPGEQDRFGFGSTLVIPVTSERLAGTESPKGQTGAVTRVYPMISGRWYAVPGSAWLRASAGFAYLNAASEQVSAKLKPAFGIGVGYRLPLASRWNLGLEAHFERVGQATRAFQLPGFWSEVADSDAGTIPQANTLGISAVWELVP